MNYKSYLLFAVFIVLMSCKKNKTDSVILYQDSLTVNNKTWLIDSTRTHVRKYSNAHYEIRVDTVPHIIDYSLAPYQTINFPYTMQVDAIIKTPNINGLSEIGLIFNYIDALDYSALAVSNNGSFWIWKRVNGSNTTLITTTYSSAILTGYNEVNTIKLIQNTTSIELIINAVSQGHFSIALPDKYIKTGFFTGTISTSTVGLFNDFVLTKN
jgi:hypothetical protein